MRAEFAESPAHNAAVLAPPSGLSRLTAPLTRRISSKIVAPYLALVFLLAILATYVVMRLVAGSLEERLTNNLLDAGRNANETMVGLEIKNLDSLRAMIFTRGVGEAVERGDTQYLQTALTPLQVNFDIDLVDVVGLDGQPVLSLRSGTIRDEARGVPPDIGRWDIVQKVLRQEQDQLGDKWSQLVAPPWGGLILYTAAPIKVGDRLVGVMLIGATGERLITELARSTLSSVTFYGPQGEVLASTLSVSAGEPPPPIDPSLYQRIMTSNNTVIQRSIQLGRGYQEMLGQLEVRRAPAAVIGVAQWDNFVTNAGTHTRNNLIVLFGVVIFFVLLIGLALARALTLPILRLVDASRQVAKGNLNTYVPPRTTDETGVLTVTFNEMVHGLREREKIKDTMGKYMTPQVAEAILKGEVKLGGERKLVTVLMSDIRGFTTLSEKLEPEALVALLNGYFERMIQAVLEYDGTIDKFIGDAILVVYGAPKYFPNHAEQAVRTSLRMRQYLAEYNAELVAQGLTPIRIGIGVNTGYVVAGDIGSSLRKEYTVMGDTVNTTQRVEDLCKEFNTDILISESTYELVKDLVVVGAEHEVTVRGRTQQTKIYTVEGMRDRPEPAARPAGRVRVVAARR